MINGYQSFRVVLNKIYRDLNLTTEVKETDVAEWCSEILEKIGTFDQYEQIKTCLDINNGKVQLPINFHKIVDISFNNIPLVWANNSMYNQYTCEGCKIPSCCIENTYNFYINNSYIITNIPDEVLNSSSEHTVCIIYLGIPTDDEGYPLVPNDVYFMEACTKYVTYMLDYREWRKGNIPDKILSKSETDYLWYVGAAKGSANMPSKRQLENLKNIWVRLIPSANFDNTREDLKRH